MLKLKQSLQEQLTQHKQPSSLYIYMALASTVGHLCLMTYMWYASNRKDIISVPMRIDFMQQPIRVIHHVRTTGALQKAVSNTVHLKASSQQASVAKKDAVPSKVVQKVPENKKAVTLMQSAQQEKNKSAKKVIKKSVQKKDLRKENIKKNMSSPKKEEHRSSQKKIEKKTVQTKQKNISPAKERKKVVEQVLAQPALLTSNTGMNQNTVQTPLEVGIEEMDQILVMDEVYKTVENTWQAPAGITPRNPCTVAISLSKAGLVEEVQIEQSSGILAYDIAVRNGMSTITFPERVWGKKIMITFNT